jgi:hypothetical protein
LPRVKPTEWNFDPRRLEIRLQLSDNRVLSELSVGPPVL